MISLSTSCISSAVSDAEAMVDFLLRLGVTAVELEYRVPARICHALKEGLKAAGIRVTSLHNYFPFPGHLPDRTPGGDLFSLADPDPDIRREAVALTCRTIEHANAMEARAVVLHCGYVEMTPENDRLKALWRQGGVDTDEGRRFIRRIRTACDRKRPAHLEALFFNLDRLIRTAEREGVLLGLETRYHYHELPGYDDFAAIFREFDGAPLGYWHDTGHANALEKLGFAPEEGFLERYHPHLVGIHLHDAIGLDDHLPPGRGEIDFSAVGALLGPEAVKVMELRQRTGPAAILEGLNYLAAHLGGVG